MNGIDRVSSSWTPQDSGTLSALDSSANQQSLVSPNANNGFASSNSASGGSNILEGLMSFLKDGLSSLTNALSSLFQGMMSGGPLGGVMSMLQKFMA